MAYPAPYEHFNYVVKVKPNGGGSYTTLRASGNPANDGSGDAYVFDNIDDGGGDKAGQIGDVSGDTFNSAYTNAPVPGQTGVIYAGKTPDGSGFVGKYYYAPTQTTYYYLYTNKKYSSGKTFQTNNAPFAICYARGTLIRTARGEIAVESLAVGDLVVTASGAERPIKWIGNRSYAGRFANNNADTLPVCFKAGSLADNVPARDLWVSPKHAMFLDGVLIPAESLVNGVTITKAERIESVTYYHVELDSHDVLLAEGAPSESYVDDDNRNWFINADEFGLMYPDSQQVEAVYCAPRVEDGYVLDAVRRRLADRAASVAETLAA